MGGSLVLDLSYYKRAIVIECAFEFSLLLLQAWTFFIGHVFPFDRVSDWAVCMAAGIWEVKSFVVVSCTYIVKYR